MYASPSTPPARPPLTTPQLSRAQIATHIQRLLTRWPADAIRPASVSVHAYLQSRLAPPTPSPQQPQSRWSQLFRRSSPAAAAASPAQQSSAGDAPLLTSDNVNALYALLENRYQRKYPLPNSLRYPASRPDYYDGLLKEFEEAPRRGWLGRMGKKLGGVLRWK
ncbi:predicted protein [Uncinocarpus reesii 1704]|uniref:Uncharacterized protein n=1 Tax=Uncinocarpus reesii (strain UAMH 1704) TaxID=336963 RepID=C4JSP6_UNCRE|nr:uncharacterized protein UREG_05485 [Uncinocarpus reesii 1704]EEP80643.1 predicted protein [Uncinocarpus reesii 1704]